MEFGERKSGQGICGENENGERANRQAGLRRRVSPVIKKTQLHRRIDRKRKPLSGFPDVFIQVIRWLEYGVPVADFQTMRV